jgi:hypothetical protein
MLNRPTVLALTLTTSTNGTAREGAALNTEPTSAGTISVFCSAAITTASVLATFKLQVSDNGTDWYDLAGGTSSNVSFATAAGTGTEVVTSKVLTFDVAVISWVQCRVVATLSGATTVAADKTTATYHYVSRGKLLQ